MQLLEAKVIEIKSKFIDQFLATVKIKPVLFTDMFHLKYIFNCENLKGANEITFVIIKHKIASLKSIKLKQTENSKRAKEKSLFLFFKE